MGTAMTVKVEPDYCNGAATPLKVQIYPLKRGLRKRAKRKRTGTSHSKVSKG